MVKNILVFSDGTGQAGGLTPDEKLTNVYKLFRATRCGPDSDIDPEAQLAFYDPGIGSPADGANIKISWARWLYNVACQATGLGLTRNIQDCYAAIVRMYRPGDRIYLFGFSRGAYTVRCLGGVLGLCGIPTQMKDGSPLKRDPNSVTDIASEAVKQVYQYGSSIKGDPLQAAREELARKFRTSYACDENGQANVVPYFIGVWDTVAALKGSWLQSSGLAVAALVATALVAWFVQFFWASVVGPIAFWPVFGVLLAIVVLALLLAYLVTHINLPKASGASAPHLSGFSMEFYDTNLNPRVLFARHAMSIDENRADFARVPWNLPAGTQDIGADGSIALPFKQVWFAGNHSDIGGGYSENESRLSDIATHWMVEQATEIPQPILVDRSLLRLFPSCAGPQHDEVKAGVNWVPRLFYRPPPWKVCFGVQF